MAGEKADPPRSEPSVEPRFFDADPYAGVLEEVERIQRKQASWLSAIIVLAVSFAMFLAFSSPGHSPIKNLWTVVPILLFHEVGHFVAMKVFRYRNLKMFFVPGFGAGVVGSHYNVPGWKRAIVSLMGPLPGIILGILIGVGGILVKQQGVTQFGLLMLIINGLNLAPVFPFDGGHIAHTLVFSRHPFLDVFFRGITAAGVIAAGAFGQSYILLGIGAAMAVSLPVTLRIARAAKTLRDLGVDPVSDDDQTIPRPMAEMIVDELRAKTPAPISDKLLAQQTLSVFETLNARPPGAAGTIGISFLYFLSLIAAIVFSFVFTLAQRGSLSNLAQAIGERPKYEIVVTDIQQTAAPLQPGPFVNVVATFEEAEAAGAAYAAHSSQVGAGRSASLFGNTLIVRLPVSDEQAKTDLLASLQPRAKDVFVDSPDMRAVFRVHAFAPTLTAAEAIKKELAEYFGLPLSEPCIPPWVASAPLTDAHRLARSTFARLQSVSTYERPEVEALNKEIAQARRVGDGAVVKAKSAQLEELTRSLHFAALEEIASGARGPADAALAREYIELASKAEYFEVDPTLLKPLAPRFGLAPPEPSPEAAQCALVGYCSSADLIVRIDYMSFADPSAGLPALLKWLSSMGCNRFYYGVRGATDFDADMGY